MSKTNWQDPGSSEILSSHISGLQEAVGKIEDAIGLQTTAETGITLSEVYISDTDRYRIYQAPEGKRNWVASPAPVIKKNGVQITTGFTIDYGGGAIILSPAAIDSDVFTADVTRVNSTHSITPASIGAETPAGAQAKADAAEDNANAYTDTHTNLTNPHSAVSTATANRLVLRDASGRAAFADPSASGDAATKNYVDTHAALTAAHSATSAATANRIMMRDASGRAKVAAPSASDDIARKDTVDTHATQSASISTLGHVKHAVLTATLDTSWSGSSAPYSKTISVSGILSTDTPIIDVTMSGTYSTDEARAEAWGYIYRAVTADGSITFYATDKPTVSLPIQIRVVR